jgi:hypothetical protein
MSYTPSEVVSLNYTGLTALLPTTVLFTSTSAQLYKISVVVAVTRTASGGGGNIGAQISYTSADIGAITINVPGTDGGGQTVLGVGSIIDSMGGTVIISVAAGSAIKVSTDSSVGSGTPMEYNVYFRSAPLG